MVFERERERKSEQRRTAREEAPRKEAMGGFNYGFAASSLTNNWERLIELLGTI